MGELADLAASPQAITVGGKEYRIAPLDFYDMGQLESWMEGMPIDVVKQHLPGLDLQQQKYLLDGAREDSEPGTINIASPKAESLLNTARGMVRIVWMSLSKCNAEFSDPKSVGRILKPDNVREIGESVLRISGMLKSVTSSSEEDNSDPTHLPIGENSSPH